MEIYYGEFIEKIKQQIRIIVNKNKIENKIFVKYQYISADFTEKKNK